MFKRIFISIFIAGILAAGVHGLLRFVLSELDTNRPIIFSGLESNAWKIQSIDTMKYSRDLAAEKLTDPTFRAVIEKQIDAIAKTGATHVAIGTPYDEKFLPFLKLWIQVARQHDLKVWFRGNWSGWEGWFGYEKNLGRDEHIRKTKEFILNNPELFSDGDLFSSCPECENGGPGDPRNNGDVVGHRKFIIDEYAAMKEAFRIIGKDVQSNSFSMNGDVARLVMDKETTKKMGGIVSIDHYVGKPDNLISDVESIADSSGGKVLLSEWGVALPDIHGEMTSSERTKWISDALYGLSLLKDKMIGMNYWLAVGGSTALWSETADVSEVSLALQSYYAPTIVYGRVTDEIGHSIVGAKIKINNKEVYSNQDGYFEWSTAEKVAKIEILADNFRKQEISEPKETKQLDVVLIKENKTFYDKFLLWSKKLLYQ
jgi:hypothetical protein